MDPLVEHALATGVLNAEAHGPLLKDLDRIVVKAGIPIDMVCRSMKEFCSDVELSYVQNLRARMAERRSGLVYVGKLPGESVQTRMMAVAGACLRNYVNAKVMTLQDVLLALKLEKMPEPTVLLIPNFFLSKNEGGSVPEWQVSGLIGLLYARRAMDLQTFVYVQSMQELELGYGTVFRKHFESHFTAVTA